MSLLVGGARASLTSPFNGYGTSPPSTSSSSSSSSPSPSPSPPPLSRPCRLQFKSPHPLSDVADGRRDAFSTFRQPSYSNSCREVVRRTPRQYRRVETFSVAQPFSGVQEEDVVQEPIVAPGVDVNSIREWELDFCSRPIIDARGKRIWELLICDCGKNFQFARFYPNNVINSITLKEALLFVVQSGIPKPQKIRFFRSQMQNIVTKACAELDIQAVPSRRCISLIRWMDERYDSVYRQHPGFQENAAPLLQLEQAFPLELPDNLRGEQWAFVQLPISGVMEEVAAVDRGDSFGSAFPLDILGLDLPPNAIIPGVAVASSRATPLAAWTNALELASIQVDRQKKCLVLSTGVSDRWLYAYYRKSRQADQEAIAWEASKKACNGLHFLAVQKSLDSDFCAGFWLLYEGPPSRV